MYRKMVKLALALFLIIFCPCNSFAEDAEPDEIKNSDASSSVQEAVNKDSELIKQLAAQSRKRPPDPEIKGVEFEIGDNEIEGSSSARLIMVQFSDYTCYHCALYTKETYPEILKNYVNRGKMRYVVVDYPLPGDTPATRAAEAVHCASEQGKFREMHEAVMSQQKFINDIDSVASFVDMDMDQFKACMESKKYESVINENIEIGFNLKIPSVPNFIIGGIDPENPKKVKGIAYIRGSKPYDHFKQEIDKALADLEEQK